jgi:hypothetical protein
MALRDISLRFEVRALSGHSGHARACGWPDLVANDPKQTAATHTQRRSRGPMNGPDEHGRAGPAAEIATEAGGAEAIQPSVMDLPGWQRHPHR